MTLAGTSDVIVIGAGPAGLAPARTAAAQGLSVLLIDEQGAAGGQIWRNAARMADRGGLLAKSYRNAAGALALLPEAVRHMAGATVLDAQPAEASVRVTWLDTASGARGIRETDARAVIVATGGDGTPVLFPGATLPGVIGVGAVQSTLKQSGMVPKGDGVVLAGQGPLLLLTLCQILDRGGTVDAVLDLSQKSARAQAARSALPSLASDPALMAQGAALLWRARRSGVAWYDGVTALEATGSDMVEGVAFTSRGKAVRLPCSLLAVHDGVIPNTQISRLLHLDHRWNAAQQSFAPICTDEGRSSLPTVWVAGDGAGIAGAEVAQLRGELVGLDVARALDALADDAFQARAAPLQRKIARHGRARVFIDQLFAPLPVSALAGPDTIVCRCEAVTHARVSAAIRDGATGPNRVKTFTRCGMGACQGRMCGNALTRIIAEVTGSDPGRAGALRVRPPLKPTLISDYLDLAGNTETPP